MFGFRVYPIQAKSCLAGLSLAFFTHQTHALTPEIFQCVRIFSRVEKLKAEGKMPEAQLYLRLNHPNFILIHPKKEIREKLFELLSAVPGRLPRVVKDLRRFPYAKVQETVSKLEAMSPSQRAKTLSEEEVWENFIHEKDQILPPHEIINGRIVYKDSLNRALKLKAELEEQGIITEFMPARTRNNEAMGHGLLVITKLNPELTQQSLKSGGTFLKSKEALKYLDKIVEEQGVLAIDPALLDMPFTVAYFRKEGGETSPHKYVIGIKADTSGSTFIHEWEHKIDMIDKDGVFPGAVGSRNIRKRKSVLGRGLFEAGWHLEKKYLTELNATGKEFGFYFETKSFPLVGVLDTVIYRSVNKVKVGVGRIFMDPTKPAHYVMALTGGGVFVFPVYIGVKGLLLALYNLTGMDPEEYKKQEAIEAELRARETGQQE